MKTPERILAVLLTVSLCALPVSCARQTAQPQPTTGGPTAAQTVRLTEFPLPAGEETSETEEESSTEPASATEATTKVKKTKKPVDPLAGLETEALRLANEERLRAGLEPLAFSEELRRCARIRAEEIRVSFSHVRPDGESCFSLNPELIMGENIAMGQRTPQQVVQAWMDSPAHREILLLERFTCSAVGCYYDRLDGTYYWVQLFGEADETTTEE